MKKTMLLTMFLISLLFITACDIDTGKVDLSKVDTDQIIKCETPYIRVGAECCVDQDDDKICDKDEIELEKLRNEPKKETEDNKPKDSPQNKTEECKEMQVPYQAKETFTEKECEPITEAADYSVELSECTWIRAVDDSTCNAMCKTDSGGCADYCRIDYIITNDAEEGGDFTFEIGPVVSFAPDRALSPHTITHHISGHSSEHFSKEFCCGPWEMEDCSIAPISIPDVDTGKEDCEEITKTRTVTKYKTETICE